MGGKGSGRKSRTVEMLNSFKSIETKTPIGKSFFIPNHSGVSNKEIDNLNVSGRDLNIWSKVVITQNSNDEAISITSSATTADVIDITCDSLTTGAGINVDSNSTDSTIRALVKIRNNNSSASNTQCLNLVQNAAKECLFIDQNSNANSLFIQSEATTQAVWQINNPKSTTGFVCNWQNANSLTTGSVLRLHSNSSTTNQRSILNVINSHSSATQAKTITAQQNSQSAAFFADVNGNGIGLEVDSEASSNPSIKVIQNSNNGGDVWAMKVTHNNAGAGNPCGIDFSDFSTDEQLFKFVADSISTAGTVSHQIAVDIAGTTYYLVAYTHGT